MRSSSLKNLRGLVTNGAQVKVQITKAINHVTMYAKRGPGYSPAAQSLLDMLEQAKVETRKWSRSTSIDATPATANGAVAGTQQITTNATFPDATVLNVSADPRVTYATSDATKATVSSTGLITRVAVGSATITVTFQGRTDTIAVTVS